MEIRLVQAVRMLGLPAGAADPDAVRAAIAAQPERFAGVLFQEAADSDDVTGVQDALDHLEARLDFFGGLLDTATERRVRAAFRDLLRAWE
ncbi:MAG: hypothetical protein HYX53_09660 [Chloroflexi bacterium]|nr:hypothetical protein [Chloroflexota bacterium]